VEVLQKENGASGANLKWRAQRGAKQRKTASIQHAFCCSLRQRLHFAGIKRALVLLTGCHGREPSILINAAGSAKISRCHGTMEGDQSRSVAQISKHHGHIATAYEDLRIP